MLKLKHQIIDRVKEIELDVRLSYYKKTDTYIVFLYIIKHGMHQLPFPTIVQ